MGAIGGGSVEAAFNGSQAPSIRPYEERDYRRVQMICIEADQYFPKEKADELLILYCNYYIEQEPENCFVLSDGDSRAVGYLLLSPDWEHYIETYRREYMPRLRRVSRFQYFQLKRELAGDADLHAAYPAHLHIDISSGYRGKGLGTAMIDAGMQHLRSLGCPGVMLGVNSDNAGAIRFYERYGFGCLKKQSNELLYGLKL